MSESDAAPLRIAFLGNVANCLLPVALALREEGFDADLFVDDAAPSTARPDHADPTLANAPWIRRGPWFTARALLRPRRARVVRLLAGYDLVVVSGPGPVFAQFAGRPWCWWVSGADLTATPFPWAFRTAFSTRRRTWGAYPLAYWQRRAAPRAQEIWVQPFAPMREAIRRLGLTTPPVADRYLPLIVDADALREWAREPVPPSLRSITDRMDAAELVVFHPSRLVMSATAANRRSGQWKGNDRLLQGLAELRDRGQADRVLLVLPDAVASRDVTQAKALSLTLGVEDHVLWASPPTGDAFTRHEMAQLYAHSHVVADEFAAGWFGFVTLEACAIGRPVVSHLDEAAMAILYPEGHPMRTALEPAEIANRLHELRDPDLRAAVGAAGEAWVRAHHSSAAAKGRYVSAVRSALEAADG